MAVMGGPVMTVTEHDSAPQDGTPNVDERVRAEAERCLATILERARIAQGDDARDEIGTALPVLWAPCATVYCPSLCDTAQFPARPA